MRGGFDECNFLAHRRRLSDYVWLVDQISHFRPFHVWFDELQSSLASTWSIGLLSKMPFDGKSH